MGVIYGLYCMKHLECLDVGKFWYLSNFSNNVPPNIVEKLRTIIEEQETNRGLNSLWLNERSLDLIDAFVKRHKDCELKVWNDVEEDKFGFLIENRDLRWQHFDVWSDGPYWERVEKGEMKRVVERIEDLKEENKQLYGNIENLNNSLLEEEKGWIHRYKLKKRIRKLKKLLVENEGYLSDHIKFYRRKQEIRNSNEFRLDQFDVLEKIKNAPFRNFNKSSAPSR